MAGNSNVFKSPLTTVALLMAANIQDPVGKINSLNQAIVSMKDALQQINDGLEMFNTGVIPMLKQPANKGSNSQK